jgi:toxin-antitoxin system PIN domain toxin
MKRLLDINTWIALAVETHPQHVAARKWYGETELDQGDLVFCRQTELGFLRLVTQQAVMGQCLASALTNAEAVEFLANVYKDPAVSRADEPVAARSLWLELAAGPRASPNVWMDAYLAAFAIALGAEMVTFDSGFTAYQQRGLKLVLLETP